MEKEEIIMGIVVEKEKGPCECFKLDETLLCHKKHVIGFLSHSQEKELCTEIHKEPASPGLKERHEEFADAAHTCSEKVRAKHPKGKRLLPYLACMHTEAEKRGLKI